MVHIEVDSSSSEEAVSILQFNQMIKSDTVMETAATDGISYFLHDTKLLKILVEHGCGQVNCDFCPGQMKREREQEWSQHRATAPHPPGSTRK